MVSSFVKYIYLLYYIEVAYTFHIGEKRIVELNKKGLSKILYMPLLMNCGVPMCTGNLAPIYCFGELISNSWQLGLQDSCPGTKLKFKPHVVMENYNKLIYPIQYSQFELFCRNNFDNVSYLENVVLKDWKREAEFLTKLSDVKQIKLALELHLKWVKLARKFTEDVHNNIELYPVVPVKNPFIVPGGQFQIYFYWDSYWILKG
uniref:Trehalase n=1 Tax=Heterorhabditis bacteriophora TaxID=37862 RepID=A0A1I7WJR1_HETBA